MLLGYNADCVMIYTDDTSQSDHHTIKDDS